MLSSNSSRGLTRGRVVPPDNQSLISSSRPARCCLKTQRSVPAPGPWKCGSGHGRGSGPGPPGGSSPQSPEPSDKSPSETRVYPVWLQVWMAATAIAYLFARTKWRADLKLRVDEMRRDEALQQRADEEWSRFQGSYQSTATTPPPPLH